MYIYIWFSSRIFALYLYLCEQDSPKKPTTHSIETVACNMPHLGGHLCLPPFFGGVGFGVVGILGETWIKLMLSVVKALPMTPFCRGS